MARLNIISVDPSTASRGELNPRLIESFRVRGSIRRQVMEDEAQRSRRSGLNFLSGLNNRISLCMSSRLFLLRLAMGLMLIALGVLQIVPATAHLIPATAGAVAIRYVAIAEIVFGGCLVLGLLTRIASVAAFIGFTAVTVMTAMQGTLDIWPMLPAIVGFFFMTTGPGVYCADQIIRRAIIRRAGRRRRERGEQRLSYRAFADNA